MIYIQGIYPYAHAVAQEAADKYHAERAQMMSNYPGSGHEVPEPVFEIERLNRLEALYANLPATSTLLLGEIHELLMKEDKE